MCDRNKVSKRMTLERILILVTFELVCSVLALSQYPASQSAGVGQSQAPASNNQNNGAAVQGEEQAPTQETKPTYFAPALSGVEVFAPVTGSGVSYVQPAVQLAAYANSNPGSTSGSSSVNGEANLVGSLALQRVRTTSQLNLTLQGGAIFNFGPSFTTSNGETGSSVAAFDSLTATETVTWHRWQLLLADQFSYLPQSAFGFTGFAGLNTVGLVPGGGITGNPLLNQAFNPNQTILTGNAQRLSNMATTQVAYRRGRSAITATAVYGTLHFLESGFIDSNSLSLFAGYNYSLTRRDTIAITALYSDFRFSGGLPGVTNRAVQLNYGRKLTHRLYLQAGAGPIATKFVQPPLGNVTTTSWTTFTSLQYLVPMGSLGLTYSRFPTSGSGVLIGAENDWVSLWASHQLSHRLNGTLNLSYAYNSTLEKSTGANQQATFNAWTAGVTLSRGIGEFMNGYLNFNVLRQTSNTSVCSVSYCGGDVVQYVIGLGVNWRPRPFRLR